MKKKYTIIEAIKEVLSNKITINTTDVFDSEEELIQYINELKQKYINLRLFDTVDISHFELYNSFLVTGSVCVK